LFVAQTFLAGNKKGMIKKENLRVFVWNGKRRDGGVVYVG